MNIKCEMCANLRRCQICDEIEEQKCKRFTMNMTEFIDMAKRISAENDITEQNAILVLNICLRHGGEVLDD